MSLLSRSLFYLSSRREVFCHNQNLARITISTRSNISQQQRNMTSIKNDSQGDCQNEPVKSNILSKINTSLKPIHLEVVNESYMHNVPRGSETHFKVMVVSEAFAGLNRLARHRAVNKLLTDEMEHGPIHALSILAHTSQEWEDKGKPVIIDPSPKCRGGFGK